MMELRWLPLPRREWDADDMRRKGAGVMLFFSPPPRRYVTNYHTYYLHCNQVFAGLMFSFSCRAHVMGLVEGRLVDVKEKGTVTPQSFDNPSVVHSCETQRGG